MPAIIQTFPLLDTIKMNNSSIEHWDDGSAITARFHPSFWILAFIRVRFKEGRLPRGLLPADFPSMTSMFVFVATNLFTLPEDLDSKWAAGSLVYFDSAQLIEVPPTLFRLSPTSLRLARTPVREVPAELFELPGLEYFALRSTNISRAADECVRPVHEAHIHELGRYERVGLPLVGKRVAQLPRRRAVPGGLAHVRYSSARVQGRAGRVPVGVTSSSSNAVATHGRGRWQLGVPGARSGLLAHRHARLPARRRGAV